jgi:hypothetical protein
MSENTPEWRYALSLCLLRLRSKFRDIRYGILTRGRHDRCITCFKKISPANPGRIHNLLGKLYGMHESCFEQNMRLSPEEVAILEKTLPTDYYEQERLADEMGESREEYVQRVEQMIKSKSLMPPEDHAQQ